MIPLQILCDPLFKLINMNFQKEDRIPNPSSHILSPHSNIFHLNVSDFQLLHKISIHQKLPTSTACDLLSIVMTVARKNILFTRVSLKLTLSLISRFENNGEIYHQC